MVLETLRDPPAFFIHVEYSEKSVNGGNVSVYSPEDCYHVVQGLHIGEVPAFSAHLDTSFGEY